MIFKSEMNRGRDDLIKVYVANLGKYNEGELVGGWIELPVPMDDLDKFLREIGLETDPQKAYMAGMGGEAVYEEYAIHDYDFSGTLKDLDYKPDEYQSLESLNLMAMAAQGLSNNELEAVRGYIDYNGIKSDDEILNLMVQTDSIPYFEYDYDFAYVKDEWGETSIERNSPEENMGWTALELNGYQKLLEDNGLMDAFDVAEYGREVGLGCELLEKGYLDLQADEPDLEAYSREELEEKVRGGWGDPSSDQSEGPSKMKPPAPDHIQEESNETRGIR